MAILTTGTTPIPTTTTPPIVGVSLEWERHGITQRNWTGNVLQITDKSGKSNLHVDIDKHGMFARNPTFDPKNRWDAALGREALSMVNEKGASLAAVLGASNVTQKQWETNTVHPGEYSIALYGQQEKPLYYVGLLKTAPQPLVDLIHGMQQLRKRI